MDSNQSEESIKYTREVIEVLRHVSKRINQRLKCEEFRLNDKIGGKTKCKPVMLKS